MKEPIWITKRDALAIHDLQIAEHGGLEGVRDEGLLESALARPENLFAYGSPDLVDLAAAYAFGIAKSHSHSTTEPSAHLSAYASPFWTLTALVFPKATKPSLTLGLRSQPER